MSNTSNLDVKGKKVSLKQTTDYPWNGNIAVEVERNSASNFNMMLRLPGWIQNVVVPSNLYSFNDGKKLSYTVSLNGKKIEPIIKDGYISIDRKWKKGDKVELSLDMEPRIVKANSKVEADKGRISVERGPIVYCAEWPDNNFDVRTVFMNREPKFEVVKKDDMLYGINMIKTDAQTLGFDDNGRLITKDVTLSLIPYYSWNHRGVGSMLVWLPNELRSTTPLMAPTLASQSKIAASHMVKSLSAVNDRMLPSDENDRSVPYYHWWPKNNSTEWITYEFEQETEISRSSVIWYDEAPWGGCRIPDSWNIYYKDGNGQWIPVSGADKFGVVKGEANEVNFNPVKTKAVKLEIVLPEKFSSGMYEWDIK